MQTKVCATFAVQLRQPCVLEQQQSDRHRGQHVHYGMDIFAAADHQIETNVRYEAPKNALGDRKRQGNKNDRKKGGEPFLDL